MHGNKLFKKIIIFAVIIILLLSVETIILLNVFSPTQSATEDYIPTHWPGRTLYVGGSYRNKYTKINIAVSSARKGDTVFVHSGNYHENIVIDKQINLVGENKNTTTIDGGGSGDVIRITADGVLLSDFTLCNGGMGQDHLNDAAIEITSNNNIIQNNNCLSTNYGIWIRDSTGNIIRDNSCIAKYDGIWLINSGGNILRNNSMIGSSLVIDGNTLQDFIQDIDKSNTMNGKPVYYYKNEVGKRVPSDAGQVILVNCEGCIVSDLEIRDVTDGIEILHSRKNTIKNNKITGTTDCGIRLVESNHNLITNNICSNGPMGIGCMTGAIWIHKTDADCKYNIIRKNTLSNNKYGIYLDTSDHNTIAENNFIGNKNSAIFSNSYNNKWHSNYWDDWNGIERKILRFTPKTILGRKNLAFFPKQMRLCINIDWDPQIEPYTI